jgi:hypothetical protein
MALALVLFRSFVWGPNTLLYKDIGGDSLNVSYPYYVLLSDYIRQVGLPSWTFRIGMGQNLFPYIGTILVSPVVWLPHEAIARALVYQHFIYVLIAGLFFARFLALRGLNFVSCLLGALLLSFSGYLCMGSCWYFHATEVVCFTILLFAAESAVSRGRWIHLVLAVALMGFFSVFHLYLCALFLCFYVPLRAFLLAGRKRAAIRVTLLVGGAAFLGAGLSAILSIGSFHSLWSSPRGAGPSSLTGTLSSTGIFGLEAPKHYWTALARFYANDLLGTGSDFRGWQNYLEAPMMYCGLISLLLLPQVFLAGSRRSRLIHATLLAAICIPIVFPWFRYLFWGFQGNYYRTFSLLCIFGLITMAMTVFSRYSEGGTVGWRTLVLTLLVLVGGLYLPNDEFQGSISKDLRIVVVIVLGALTVLLLVGQLLKRQRAFAWAVVAMAAIELLYFDERTVAYRPVVTKDELKQRVGYNDETVDIIREIKESDHSFFRVTKAWASSPSVYVGLNDAMVFGFYGTSSYSSFNNLSYINFLVSVGAIAPENMRTFTRWSRGLFGHPILSTFACEKYVLTADPEAFEKAGPYQLMRREGSISIFRNVMAVPLGLTFTQFISENDFRTLPSAAREQVLLYAVVLPDKAVADAALPQLTLENLRREFNESDAANVIELRRKTALHMSSFAEPEIKGTVTAETKSVLVMQTSYDRGWRSRVDGQPVDTIEVDGGLVGVPLPGGEHAVDVYYVPAFRAVGGTISCVALCLVVFLAWKWPRIKSAAVKGQPAPA